MGERDDVDGGEAVAAGGGLHAVRLLGLPVPLHQRAVEHLEELQREFVYIAVEPGGVPARMLELGRRIRAGAAPFTRAPEEALEAAIVAGAPEVDLEYRVPDGAAAVARAANAMLDEVDGFCARGGMLTLAAAPDVLAYRRWFFGQFEAQIGGDDPVPWPAFAAARLPA